MDDLEGVLTLDATLVDVSPPERPPGTIVRVEVEGAPHFTLNRFEETFSSGAKIVKTSLRVEWEKNYLTQRIPLTYDLACLVVKEEELSEEFLSFVKEKLK